MVFADGAAFLDGEGDEVGVCALGAGGEVGGYAEELEEGAFVPEQRKCGFVACAVLEGFEEEGEGDVEGFIDLLALCGAQGEVAGVAGGCGAVPTGAERFSKVEGGAFTDVVHAIAAIGVEDEFAGVADVVFTQEGAFGALGAFDGGG